MVKSKHQQFFIAKEKQNTVPMGYCFKSGRATKVGSMRMDICTFVAASRCLFGDVCEWWDGLVRLDFFGEICKVSFWTGHSLLIGSFMGCKVTTKHHRFTMVFRHFG